LSRRTANRWGRVRELRRKHPQLLVVVPLVVAAAALAPLGGRVRVYIPGLVPAVLTLGLVAALACVALLVRLYRSDRSSLRPIGLAGCFVFSALLEVVFIGAYPNLLIPHGQLLSSTDLWVWVWTVWQGGTLLAVFSVLGLSNRTWASLTTMVRIGPKGLSAVLWSVVRPIGLAAIGVSAAVAGAALGPRLVHGLSYAGWGQLLPGVILIVALLFGMRFARRVRAASPVERWTMAASLIAASTMALAILAGRRHSLGWDGSWVIWALGEVIFSLALVYQVVAKSEAQQEWGNLQRRAITERLGRLDPRAPLGQIARAICAELVQLPGVDCAQVVRFDSARTVTPTMACAEGDKTLGEAMAARVPELRERDLHVRSRDGAFLEIVSPAAESDQRVRSYLEDLRRAGIGVMAHAPIGVDNQVSWVISVGRKADSESRSYAELGAALPILVDVAGAAAILLAPTLRHARTTAQARRGVELILARRTFRPVFQPVVNVDDRRIIGHEALTRFDDQTAPDVALATAATVGLGVELELACLRAAVAESRGLGPGGRWLSLNVSPAMLTLATEEVADVVAWAHRPIVLELTEHVIIDDYAPILVALRRLRPDVKLAVDDVGAGFASLRHILELNPDFIKLDISLVRDIDQDPVRQAMVAGLVSFGGKARCELIAEGVESAAELSELSALGVHCAQGYLIGRPAPVTVGSKEPWLIRRRGRPHRRQAADVATTPT
jgi:EAL domain-containing protein (putative c-di-GMP-specific phosphodiesterase class I)